MKEGEFVGRGLDSSHWSVRLPWDCNWCTRFVADESGSICESYGVWQLKKFMGREYMGIVRSTFVIDARGVVRAAWSKVRVKGHAHAVLDAVRAL